LDKSLSNFLKITSSNLDNIKQIYEKKINYFKFNI